jgi:hypothetical protein
MRSIYATQAISSVIYFVSWRFDCTGPEIVGYTNLGTLDSGSRLVYVSSNKPYPLPFMHFTYL